ncbi:MAG: hypothetical protein Q8O40_02985 [Chloroflexota bacterium]|nr:hypothetical protein [Chloroflexota bacterium]
MEARLRSNNENYENDFFSALLELYFNHHFKSNGSNVTLHPAVAGSEEHPDYLIEGKGNSFYLEATIRHEEPEFAKQAAFARALEQELRRINSRHTVWPDISAPCPHRSHLASIRGFLEHELVLFGQSAEAEKDVTWRETTVGTSYQLGFRLKRGSGIARPLEEHPTWGGMSDILRCLYDTIDGKARKYGSLELPFVIAVWGLSSPDETGEIQTLYGKTVMQWKRDSRGDYIEGSDSVTSLPNGIFTRLEQGKYKYSKVSAVAFYGCKLQKTGAEHSLRVYHNPYALRPLPSAVFQGFPQFVPQSGQMQWIDAPPNSLTE